MRHYQFTDMVVAKTMHAAIDDARLGPEGHWPDGVTERHTSLVKDETSYLIAVTRFTEALRGTTEEPGLMWKTLPEPVTVDLKGTVERFELKRTDTLSARRLLR